VGNKEEITFDIKFLVTALRPAWAFCHSNVVLTQGFRTNSEYTIQYRKRRSTSTWQLCCDLLRHFTILSKRF